MKFDYGSREISWLTQRDEILGDFIKKRGIIHRNIFPEPFSGLCRAIIGQQLGDKAHNAIWNRFIAAFPKTLPEALLSVSVDKIKQCGMSLRKAQTIQEAAHLFMKNHFLDLAELSDEEAIKKLQTVKGIGGWTAEMLLIFTFQRKNVLSCTDLGLKKGLCKLYGYKEVTEKTFASHKEIYAPYSTIAAFYLWEINGL